MMKTHIAYTLLFLAAAISFTDAQQRITIQTLYRQALERNPKLHAARTRITAAQARIRRATAWDDPQFSFEFFQTPVSSLNPLSDNMENDYSLQQMIPFPGKKTLMGDMASWNARMSEASFETVRRQLFTEVASAHAMLYAARKRLGINAENQRTIMQIIEAANARIVVGAGAQADVLILEVEREKGVLEDLRLRQESYSATAMLNTLRAMPQDVPLSELEPPVFAPPPDGIDSLVESALRTRPELAGMNAEIEMNRSDRALQQKERLPDFMVRGMYKQMLMDGPDYWALMVGVNITIAPWASGKYSGRIEEAEANIMASEQTYSDMAAMIAFEVRDAWQKTRSLWSQLERYRIAILPAAESAYRSALAKFQSNGTEFRTVLETLRMVDMSRMDQAMLEADYLASFARLYRSAGIEPVVENE